MWQYKLLFFVFILSFRAVSPSRFSRSDKERALGNRNTHAPRRDQRNRGGGKRGGYRGDNAGRDSYGRRDSSRGSNYGASNYGASNYGASGRGNSYGARGSNNGMSGRNKSYGASSMNYGGHGHRRGYGDQEPAVPNLLSMNNSVQQNPNDAVNLLMGLSSVLG